MSMYVLITYDVEAKRTEKFKKLLRKYLDHIQYSVFSGDLSEAKLIELRRSISRLLKPGERVTEVTAANRKNVCVAHFMKNESGKGEAERCDDNSHASDYGVL
jgi:CRISPR-associated protein Cas2